MKMQKKLNIINGEIIGFSNITSGKFVDLVVLDNLDGEEYMIKIKKDDIMKVHDAILNAYIHE
jgi:hypothetical protein